MNVLPFDKQVRIISALAEGCSIRATERLTDTHRDTVMKLGIKVGTVCDRLHNNMMRDLQVNCLQLDETWAFIQKKQKRVEAHHPQEQGDCYLWLALDAN